MSISATQRLKTSLADAVEECSDYPEDGVTLIIRERARQVQECGYSTNHDDEHKFGELRAAAIAYLLSPDIGGEGPVDCWPFERESFKPGVGIEPLVKAGAMIVAEIDRLLRAQAATAANCEPHSMQSPPANPDAVVRQHSPPDVPPNACKWVVGQWVTWRDEQFQIASIDNALTLRRWDGKTWRLSLNNDLLIPFEWKIGKRYQTTIDGVTATIDESYTSSVLCKLPNGIGRLSFDNRTGKPHGLERVDDIPHLLPFLADEQPVHQPIATPIEHPSRKIREMAAEALAEYEAGKTVEWTDEDEAWVTGNRPDSSETLQQLTDVQAKLAAYRDVCQRLWPFVRYFIIAGACPEAINCVVDLGRLLGHTEASKSTIAEIGERVRAETLDEVAAQLETLLRGKVLSKYLPEVLDAVRKL